MIKISFYLKKTKTEQSGLKYITIAEPKIDKTKKYAWGHGYSCEIHLPNSEGTSLLYGINPIDTLCLATEVAKNYLQILVSRGFTVSEVESHQPWQLEKKDAQTIMQNKVDIIKSNPNMSLEDKQKILAIMKESFGRPDSPIKDQINKAISEDYLNKKK